MDVFHVFKIAQNIAIWFQSCSTELKSRLPLSAKYVKMKFCTVMHKQNALFSSVNSFFYQNEVCVVFLEYPMRIRAPLRLKRTLLKCKKFL